MKEQKMLELKEKFISEMQRIFKEEYADFVWALNKKNRKSISFNPKKLKDFDFKTSMFKDLEKVKWAKHGYYVEEEETLSTHPYYMAGLYYFQEASAMAPVCNMPLKPGMKVLDLCSAPGGKTLQIASELENHGFLLSNDISVSRQRATLRNVEKFGLKNVLVSAESPEKIAKNYPNYFDCVLVDAPCSGEGMFSKDKKTLAAWTEESNELYSKKQLEILNAISPALKVGGYLMYSTCTFSDLENEDVIGTFLSQHKNYEIVDIKNDVLSQSLDSLKGAKRILPHKQDGLGHFLALIQKRRAAFDFDGENPVLEEEPNSSPSKKEMENLRKALDTFFDFCKELGMPLDAIFEEDFSERNAKEMERKCRLYSDKLYLISGLKIPEKSFRVLRNGLLLGEIKHDKFIPSQALAMALNPHKVEKKLSFPLGDLNLSKYLKGETLAIKAKKGYILLCVDGLPFSWALSDGKKLKNKLKRDWIQ